MSSEQNMPEVQVHQGPPPPPAQMGGQMGQDSSAQDGAHSIPHGMGQSKSSRRRRRKRKNKSPDAGQQSAQGGAGQFVGDIQANGQGSASSAAQPQNFQPGSAQQQNGAGPATKRWKKKFRDRDRQRPSDNPGNQASAGAFNANGAGYRDKDTHQPGNSVGGFKRKGKQQRGPRSFVGPMDFFHMRGAPEPLKSSKTAQNEELSKRLWTVSEQLTGVQFAL